MEKLIVYFKADEQELVCCNPFRVSSKKVAYVEAHFDLGENWTGYDSVRAIWRNTQNFAIIGTVLDSQGICKVPTEVLTSIGQIDVNLVGSISENDVLTDRLTTYPVEAGRVDANALVDGSETAEITPSQFEQFAAAVRNDAERAREGAEAAESYADAAAGSADAAAGSAQSAADDAERIAQMIQDVIEQIEDFYGVTVSVETLPAGSQATARYEEGHLYLGIPKGDKGDTGNGIASITKTGTSGLVDTYTITYTDGQTETFTVTNGEKGDTGNGIDRIELTSTSGYVKTYTIYFTDGSTTTFDVTDGEVSLEDYYKLFIEDTASGSIASFPDGADDIPMISVLADIDPIQDLHGYDKPWSGGAGKNLLDYNQPMSFTADENTMPMVKDGVHLAVGTYTLSCKQSTVLSSVTRNTFVLGFGSSYIYLTPLTNTSTNKIINTFDITEEGDYNIYLWMHSPSANVVCTEFQLEKGSTATSYAPYSNECPISGHTECVTSISPYEQTEKHTITGKNLYNAPNDFSGEMVACHIENGQTVTASCASSGAGIRYYNASKEQIDYWTLTQQSDGRYYRSFTASGGIEYVQFYGADSTDYMVEIGTSTPSAYEPYGTSHTTSLGRTVYGGEVEVVGGSLTDKMGMVDLGSLTWGGNANFFYSMNFNAKPKSGSEVLSNAICDSYEQTGYNAVNGNNGKFGISADGTYLKVCDTNYSSASEFKTAMSGHYLCYELAQPQTYQLSPQQIDSLLGINNVWADTGDVTVKYRADTKLYIDKVLAS